MYTELRVKKLGRHSWVLLDKWVTPFGTVPKGFVSNGASVPRWLWWFIPPAGVLFEASILHDYYYVNAIRTKHYADRAFRKVAKHYGASKTEYTLAYHGVRLIGRGAY